MELFSLSQKERQPMYRKWSLMTSVIALVMLLLLTACGGSSTNTSKTGNGSGLHDPNKKYTVSFWEVFTTGANKTSLQAWTKQYMQAHPTVTITLQSIDSYSTLKP